MSLARSIGCGRAGLVHRPRTQQRAHTQDAVMKTLVLVLGSTIIGLVGGFVACFGLYRLSVMKTRGQVHPSTLSMRELAGVQADQARGMVTRWSSASVEAEMTARAARLDAATRND